MREFDEKNKLIGLNLASRHYLSDISTRKMKESALQRKIVDVRKKLSLCEGKRRAIYNQGK